MPRDATSDGRHDDRRNGRRRVAAVLVALVAAVVMAGLGTLTDPVAAVAATPPTTEPTAAMTATSTDATVGATVDTAPATTFFNDFIPENANLSDCISALPGPHCGSEARGGWHQLLVFLVIAAAMIVVGTRVFISVRRRDHERNAA